MRQLNPNWNFDRYFSPILGNGNVEFYSSYKLENEVLTMKHGFKPSDSIQLLVTKVTGE